jgi:hypothetical protein
MQVMTPNQTVYHGLELLCLVKPDRHPLAGGPPHHRRRPRFTANTEGTAHQNLAMMNPQTALRPGLEDAIVERWANSMLNPNLSRGAPTVQKPIARCVQATSFTVLSCFCDCWLGEKWGMAPCSASRGPHARPHAHTTLQDARVCTQWYDGSAALPAAADGAAHALESGPGWSSAVGPAWAAWAARCHAHCPTSRSWSCATLGAGSKGCPAWFLCQAQRRLLSEGELLLCPL